jgi:HlyD family secretion protein
VAEGAVSEEYVFQAEQSLRQIQRQITQTQLQDLTTNKGQVFDIQQTIKDLKFNRQKTEGDLILAIAERQKLNVELTQKKQQAEKTKLENQQKNQQLNLEITQLKSQIAEAKKALSSLESKVEDQTIKAPIDGVISSLDLQNVGQIVQSGDTIAEVAPENMPLVLSALLPSQEAGLVKLNMPVKIKLDAYPYQDYGLINGTVSYISSDSKPHEELGQVYQIEIALAQNYIIDEGKKVIFKPGQTANAEIILRRRRIIDILLEPIRGLQKGGVSL